MGTRRRPRGKMPFVFVVVYCLIWAAAIALAAALFSFAQPWQRALLVIVMVIASRELLYVTLRR